METLTERIEPYTMRWHVHYFPDGSVGYEWGLDAEGKPTEFGTGLGIQPPDGTGNGCPCAKCRELRPNESAAAPAPSPSTSTQ